MPVYLNKDELANFVKQYENNCAQFILDFTRLFYDNDGTYNDPYKKQVEFMNCLNPKDKLIVVLKTRQCLVGDTEIKTPNGSMTIKEIVNKKYDGKILTNNVAGNVVEDEVLLGWESGEQATYEIKLESGNSITCTAEHRFNTNKGWQTIHSLFYNFTEGDILNIGVRLDGENFSKIESITPKGIQPTYDISTNYHESYLANGIHVHNCGISTAIVAYAVHAGYFGKYPEIVIISATRKQAMKVMRRVKKCFQDMPEDIRPSFNKETSEELGLSNGTQIISLSSNPQAARGYTGLILWDETAMMSVREQKEMFEAVFPATTKGGKLIMVSTPFGNEGVFFDFCTKELDEITGNPKNKAKIRKFLIHWKDVPHIVKAVQQDNLFDYLPQDTIDQEYELQFKADNIEEQYFTRDFMLANWRERNEDIPIYTSYTELGIDVKAIDNLDDDSYTWDDLSELKERYEIIKAGWDIASTENDSVLSVVGKVKGSNVWHKIGSFLVNRASSSLHDTILQVKYVKRIIRAMFVDKLTIDATGLGKSVWQYIENEQPELKELSYPYDYNKEDKLGDFVEVKNKITNGLFKRSSDDPQFNEELKQYTNIRLNKLNNSLKAKGRDKDDVPNADMLALSDNEKANPKIMVI